MVDRFAFGSDESRDLDGIALGGRTVFFAGYTVYSSVEYERIG
jgi:hypothetical protein